jgi:hypothetical protein
MITAAIRKTPFSDLGALPPDPRDLARSCLPVSILIPPGLEPLAPALAITVQAPQSALGLHPCIALSSAAANTRIRDHWKSTKAVIVAGREK